MADDARWENEVVEVSDRASTLVRDQVRATLGRAHRVAAELERDAEKEADAIRTRARHAAERVLESIAGIEAGLDEHIRRLKQDVERSEAASEVPAELLAASEAVEEQAELLRRTLSESRQEGAEVAPTPTPSPSPAPAPAESSADGGLEAQARARVTGQDDATLIDLYATAERHGDDSGDADYWLTLQRAVVAEAAQREKFAEDLDAGAGLKRSRRKEQRRALDAIRAAMEPTDAGSA